MNHVQGKLMKKYDHGIFLHLLWEGNVKLKDQFHELGEEQTWQPVFSTMPTRFNKGLVIGLVLWHSAQAYCDYCFRISSQLQSYPLRFFFDYKVCTFG